MLPLPFSPSAGSWGFQSGRRWINSTNASKTFPKEVRSTPRHTVPRSIALRQTFTKSALNNTSKAAPLSFPFRLAKAYVAIIFCIFILTSWIYSQVFSVIGSNLALLYLKYWYFFHEHFWNQVWTNIFGRCIFGCVCQKLMNLYFQK